VGPTYQRRGAAAAYRFGTDDKWAVGRNLAWAKRFPAAFSSPFLFYFFSFSVLILFDFFGFKMHEFE
jgi:hypothetical protein